MAIFGRAKQAFLPSDGSGLAAERSRNAMPGILVLGLCTERPPTASGDMPPCCYDRSQAVLPPCHKEGTGSARRRVRQSVKTCAV
jgi:hypothetical protein